MTYAELQAALAEFDLSEQATLQEIRLRHRELVMRYHPDRGAGADEEKIRRINAAYKVIMAYIQRYKFDFSKERFWEQYPEERLREQFYDADLWLGKGH